MLLPDFYNAETALLTRFPLLYFIMCAPFAGAVASSHLTARLHLTEHGSHCERAVEVHGREYHALTFNAHHLARRKVGDEQYILADELFRLIVGGDAAEDGARSARTVVDGELQQLLALLHFLAVDDVSHADVHLLEGVEVHVLLHRCGDV